MYLPNDTLLQNGKYRIIRSLSHGGFGCTYEAEHTRLHKRIAIKEFFVKDHCNRDRLTHHVSVSTQSKVKEIEKFRQKFIDEAVAISQMEHPHIINVSDVFEENGTAYYVMDFISGGSLGNLIQRLGHLEESTALYYIVQVADALRYVHSLNRLHLDLKPGNIMINAQNNAVLIDFGASKHYDEASSEQTSTNLGIYSPGFAPAEQISTKTFSPSIDIYALGATLYKCLTGQTPPPAVNLLTGIEELTPLPATISEATRRAVSQSMQGRSKDRPQSIDAFLALLDAKPATMQQAVSSSDEIEATIYERSQPVLLNRELTKVAQEPKEVVAKKPEFDNNVQTFTVNGVSFTMIQVDGGTFTMGATREQSWYAGKNEKPTHRVTLSSYYIGQTEVTQALWQAVMGSNPSHFKGNNRPVEEVSWNDCQEFVQKLNQLTSEKFRLPTEAEWEFAARGGNKSNGYTYAGSNNLDDIAWHVVNSSNKTHEVATKAPNELGVYDMTGNVSEWCADWFGKYSNSAQTNPTGPTSGSYRVYRGGSIATMCNFCPVSLRNYYAPWSSCYDLGLRLAL